MRDICLTPMLGRDARVRFDGGGVRIMESGSLVITVIGLPPAQTMCGLRTPNMEHDHATIDEARSLAAFGLDKVARVAMGYGRESGPVTVEEAWEEDGVSWVRVRADDGTTYVLMPGEATFSAIMVDDRRFDESHVKQRPSIIQDVPEDTGAIVTKQLSVKKPAVQREICITVVPQGIGFVELIGLVIWVLIVVGTIYAAFDASPGMWWEYPARTFIGSLFAILIAYEGAKYYPCSKWEKYPITLSAVLLLIFIALGHYHSEDSPTSECEPAVGRSGLICE